MAISEAILSDLKTQLRGKVMKSLSSEIDENKEAKENFMDDLKRKKKIASKRKNAGAKKKTSQWTE